MTWQLKDTFFSRGNTLPRQVLRDWEIECAGRDVTREGIIWCEETPVEARMVIAVPGYSRDIGTYLFHLMAARRVGPLPTIEYIGPAERLNELLRASPAGLWLHGVDVDFFDDVKQETLRTGEAFLRTVSADRWSHEIRTALAGPATAGIGSRGGSVAHI